MDNEQWEQAGRFLGNLQAWFRDAFQEVLESLDEKDSPRVLSLRPDGVLHLATTGSGRIRLQAFLSGPWIVWELIATTKTLGRPPTLEATPWEKLPQLCMDGWSAAEENDEDCEVYVCDGDPIRWTAVYHRPQAWDRHRKSLLVAWPAALARLQGNNFMRKSLQQSFLDAVKDR